MADEKRIAEIATRLLTDRLSDPAWTLTREEFYSAVHDAIDMEALGVPDDVLDRIAPRPGVTDG